MSVRRLLVLVMSLLAFGCQSAVTRPGVPAAPKVPPEAAEKIERLGCRNADVKAFVCRQLGEMGEKAFPAIPYLVKLLGDRSSTIWGFDFAGTEVEQTCPGWEAAEALVKIGSQAVQPLIEAL